MHSDWLFSCYDRALLTTCARHIQSVFNFKGHPYGHPCYGQLIALKGVSADQCHLTVSQAQAHGSLR